MIRTFNADTLVEVQIVDKEVSYYWSYQEAKKSFWGNRKEGFRNIFDINGSVYTKEQVEAKKMIVENNKVYCLPHVILFFMGKREYRRNFRSYDDAVAWGNEKITKINRTIII